MGSVQLSCGHMLGKKGSYTVTYEEGGSVYTATHCPACTRKLITWGILISAKKDKW